MNRNPFEVLTDVSKETINRNLKIHDFIYSQTDNIVAWLIGFAVTGITLIASDIGSISGGIKGTTKPVVLFLTLTICFGLIYRYISYLVIIKHKTLEHYFAGVYSELNVPPYEIDSEIEESNFEYIIYRLRDDFDENVNYPIDLTDQQKAIETPRLIAHYKNLCEHTKKQMDVAVRHFADVLYTAFRIDPKITANQFYHNLVQPKIGFNQANWQTACSWFFFLTLLSFLCAVVIVCVFLMNK